MLYQSLQKTKDGQLAVKIDWEKSQKNIKDNFFDGTQLIAHVQQLQIDARPERGTKVTLRSQHVKTR